MSIHVEKINLVIVKSYKYLGIHITDSLDSNEQWTRIESDIKSNTYLLKQLKSSGREEQILVSVFKSLVLIHFRYRSVVLDSCPSQGKNASGAKPHALFDWYKETGGSRKV
jgi:hypothetical protein